MNLTLNRIPVFVIKAQRYLPIAMLILGIIRVIVLDSPEGDGGTGL